MMEMGRGRTWVLAHRGRIRAAAAQESLEGAMRTRGNRPMLTLRLVFQNLEMHDRMEHLIEKQISHSNFSTQTRAKTENLGR